MKIERGVETRGGVSMDKVLGEDAPDVEYDYFTTNEDTRDWADTFFHNMTDEQKAELYALPEATQKLYRQYRRGGMQHAGAMAKISRGTDV